MASGPSGGGNCGSKGYDFGSDDILCSFEDHTNQDSANGSHIDPSKDFHISRMTKISSLPATVYNSPEGSLSQDVIATVEKSMKTYADNLMRFLEGIGSRLSQLELYCYNIDKSIGEMRSELNSDHEEADLKFKSLEKHLQEVNRSVQIIRDKQELADTQKKLAKLQLVQKESSFSSHPQSNEKKSSTSATDQKRADNASDTRNQQLALALPHQVAFQQQPVAPPTQAPGPNVTQAIQQPRYYMLPTSLPNPPAVAQLSRNQYLPSDPQYRNPQSTSSQVTQSLHVQQFSQYSEPQYRNPQSTSSQVTQSLPVQQFSQYSDPQYPTPQATPSQVTQSLPVQQFSQYSDPQYRTPQPTPPQVTQSLPVQQLSQYADPQYRTPQSTPSQVTQSLPVQQFSQYSDPQYRNPQSTSSQVTQSPPVQQFSQYQQPQQQQRQWPQGPQQLPQQVQPLQPPSMQSQTRPPSTNVNSPYLTSQATHPPPTDTLPNSMPMQMPYSGIPPPGSSHGDPMPYGYSGTGRTAPQQPPPQQIKGHFPAQPGDVYGTSGTHAIHPPASAYVRYEGEGGTAPYPPQPQPSHFGQAGYPPSGASLQNPAPHNPMVRNPSQPQFIRSHPYNELIEKLVTMGFRGNHVASVIQRMEEIGQPVDFNTVLDRLNVHSSVGPQRGWSG